MAILLARLSANKEVNTPKTNPPMLAWRKILAREMAGLKEHPMESDELSRLHRKLEEFLTSENGRKELRRIGEETRRERLEREKASRIDAENLYRPFTI